MSTEELMSTWTIYDRPTDYPHGYIARRFVIAEGELNAQPTDDTIKRTDLEVLRREMMQLGLFCITRSPEDHETVVETWL